MHGYVRDNFFKHLKTLLANRIWLHLSLFRRPPFLQLQLIHIFHPFWAFLAPLHSITEICHFHCNQGKTKLCGLVLSVLVNKLTGLLKIGGDDLLAQQGPEQNIHRKSPVGVQYYQVHVEYFFLHQTISSPTAAWLTGWNVKSLHHLLFKKDTCSTCWDF